MPFSCPDTPALVRRLPRLRPPAPRRVAALLVALAALGSSGPASALIVFSPHFLGVVGAGQDLEIRVEGGRVLLLEATAGTPNLVAGHPENAVADGRVGATIAGGGGPSTDAQKIWGDYGTIGGGRRNDTGGAGPLDNFPDTTVRGGDQNTAAAASATVGGGWLNSALGAWSTVSGGSSNDASGVGSSIGGGFGNVASGDFATVPGGQWADADRYGQLAFSAGSFGPPIHGDAQTSLFVFRRQTSGAAPAELFLDGAAARLTVAPDRALAFRVVVAARSDLGESAGYTATGVVANKGGTTGLVGALSKTVLGEDDAAWDFTVQASDVHDALVLLVAGSASTIRWVATVEATEVAQ